MSKQGQEPSQGSRSVLKMAGPLARTVLDPWPGLLVLQICSKSSSFLLENSLFWLQSDQEPSQGCLEQKWLFQAEISCF